MKDDHKKKDDNLLAVTVNDVSFEYDIHSLVKAFYPACEVRVFGTEEGDEQFVNEQVARENSARERNSSGEGLPDIDIRFLEDAILISVVVAGEEGNSFQAQKIALSENMERPDIKNSLKQLLYAALSEHTKKTLPWGSLTGIRPTKIPMALLEEDAEEADILDYMQNVYLLSQEKASLALEIAKKERKLLSGLDQEKGYSLYIGIPFCPTTCLYCSFTSYPIVSWKKRVGEYLDALDKEIDFLAEEYQHMQLETVYIGGGTPTTLTEQELDRLFNKLKDSLDFSHVKEFTVEAGRADSITPEKLAVMKRYGVTRISVNPQSMNQKTLDLIGRKHTVEQVKEAFFMAREAGFDNINMDLILGLPGEEAEDVKRTLEEIKALKPDSLTVHSLAVKRASRLSQWIEENGMESFHNTEETMQIAMDGAVQMGMEPYYLYRQKNMAGNFENVGYAAEGKEGLYNILIMEEKQTIAALGAGSISKRIFPDGRIERCDNVKDVNLYIQKIDEMIQRKRNLLLEK